MRVFSREMLVGFSLALALVVAACQPIQPVTEGVPPPAKDTVTQDTVTQDTAGAKVGEPVTSTVAISDSATAAPVAAVVATEEAIADPALLGAGLATYRAQYCGVCHTLDAAETRGTFGPPHNGMGATAAARLLEENYSGSATTAAEYIRESIVEPQVYIAPGYATTSHRMPTYAHLDSATVDALVAFLLAQ